MRALSETELAWKLEGTRSYQDLTRRCVATMVPTAPLSAPEPGREHHDLPELKPLSELKANER
jgi:phenylacetic acid degradation protein